MTTCHGSTFSQSTQLGCSLPYSCVGYRRGVWLEGRKKEGEKFTAGCKLEPKTTCHGHKFSPTCYKVGPALASGGTCQKKKNGKILLFLANFWIFAPSNRCYYYFIAHTWSVAVLYVFQSLILSFLVYELEGL